MTLSTTARPLGQIATRTARHGHRRSNGQVRAAERTSVRREIAADIASLGLVTVR